MALAVIPEPAATHEGEGRLRLDASAALYYPEEFAPAAHVVATELRSGTGWELPRRNTPAEISFDSAPELTQELGEEGYELSITDRVEIRAATAAGAFYGAQTLRQLLPAQAFRSAPIASDAVELPQLEIRDTPRFGYRGVMVDVARHFLPKPDLLRFIATIANLKINVLHLHLTDDQGWRVEIRAFPRLTEVGSHRTRSSRGAWRWQEYEETPHGGYYTQDDIREIVAYAAARNITVLPEIDVPGHSQAAIAAYPHLARLEEEVEVWPRWGINDLVLDPREETLDFYRQVFDEVIELFPGRWIGLGGDEVPFRQWQQDPSLIRWAEEQGLSGVEELHEWFVCQLAEHVAARGRTPVVWDELAGAGLPPGTLVHAWRTDDVITRAHEAGQPVVVCTEKDLYFDYTQSDREDEPIPVGKVTAVEQVAAYEPPEVGVNGEASEAIVGVQGNLWSEHLNSPARLEYAAFPRVIALAEAAWSAPKVRRVEAFMEKLPSALARLDAAGVNYRPLTGPRPWHTRPGVKGRMHGADFVAGRIEGQADA